MASTYSEHKNAKTEGGREDVGGLIADLASRPQVNKGRRKLKGPERAAVLMLSLGEKYDGKIFNLLDDDELRDISIVMSSLGTIEAESVEEFLLEFVSLISGSGNSKVPLPDLEGGGDVQAVADAGALAPSESGSVTRGAADLEALFDVPVQVSAVLGRARMEIGDLLKLGPGAVLELDRKVGEAIDIYVNNRLVARGEMVLVEDKLGVTMTEIIKADRN